ncbi:NB-ARC domain-containing protein [Anabaena sp. UHCC 0451]|uniref:NB-ARC domain-containing protein n=1 Tax=Anabaena sp. UHCC 0451 TaxID=2055235 RepID=UPI002B20837E|nr:NB-ARC domain-containing protein [Anabaena sp. UHCC 0451]MEA5576738.1 NB-ARC domain-containing protein [Anabaena sp. UHCC 0451]
MDAKELIQLFKDWVKREKEIEIDLDPCEEAILEYSLKDEPYKQMKIPSYAPGTIMIIKGPKLFKKLSEIIGTDVNKKNCRLVLDELLKETKEPVREANTKHLSEINLHINLREAPDVSDFYGREKELSDLQKWVVTESCRVVGVLGINGIGKSALVRELVEKVKNDFDYVIWKSIEYSPSLAEILTDIECYFSSSSSEIAIDRRTTNLISFLTDHRCLLIFDQWECVMTNGESLDNEQKYQYERFLRRIGESAHKSCLVFISIKKPGVIDRFGHRRNIQQLSLCGLEYQDAKTLLTELGLVNPGIEQLIEIYKGHPLALILASEPIKNIHNGQIYEFLEGTIYIPDVMMGLLDKLFFYLKSLEIQIMQKLAIATEPLLISQIAQFFPSKGEIGQAIGHLWQLRLIEQADILAGDKILWVLNPLIKKYIKRRYN